MISQRWRSSCMNTVVGAECGFEHGALIQKLREKLRKTAK